MFTVWQQTAFPVPLILTTLVALTSALYVWRHCHTPSSKTGVLLLMANAVWALGSLLELAGTDLPTKIFWNKAQYVGIITVPTAWLIYTLQYTGRKNWLTRRALALAGIVPLGFLLLVFTNEAHDLMWTRARLDTIGSFTVLNKTMGLGFQMLVVYLYIAVLLSAFLLGQSIIRSHQSYRWQARVLLFAMIIPWMVNALVHIYDLDPLTHHDLTPIPLGPMSPLIAWSLYRLQQASIVPVAYSAIFEGMSDSAIVLDTQNRVVDLNPAAQRLIGHTAAEIVGQPVAQVWPAWAGQIDETGNEILFQQGNAQYTFDVRTSPLFDWRGNLISQVVVLRDITALKRRTVELATVLEASKAVLSTLDLETVLVLIAQEMVKAVGVTACTLLRWDREADTVITWVEWHSAWSERSDEPDTSYALDDFPATRAVLETRQPTTIYASDPHADPAEVAHMRETKSSGLLMLPLSIGQQVIGLVKLDHDQEGRSFTTDEIHLCQVLADQASVAIENARLFEQAQREIAERRQAEAALERYAAELERSNRELEQFAHVASHDLQEPLRTVTSYVQLLEMYYKGQLDAAADDYIAFIVDGAARMRELIKGLLTYSRVSTDGASFQTTDCQAVLERVLANLQTSIEESNATVTHDPLPTVTADATQLARVFQNLISNAIKFKSDRSPEIHVGAEQRNSRSTWLFSVRDNGIGIEPQYIERIFLIFQRLHNRDEYPGAGIGLAVCKRVVERHGGQIWVESEPGQSSTFYFTLPERR